MLPPLLKEGDYRSFKFWFNHKVRDGIVYHNELFCRTHSVPVIDRSKLYREACKLAQNDEVIVTAANDRYSLWLSLRSSSLVHLVKSEGDGFPAKIPSSLPPLSS